LRKAEAERLGGLQIKHQLEFGRLLDRKNPHDVDGVAYHVGEVIFAFGVSSRYDLLHRFGVNSASVSR
jgi:hypothetical protein